MSKRGLVCPEPSLAKQSAADDVDVNKLMERFAKTGQLSVSDIQPVYGDATNVPDLFTSMTIVRNAERAFLTLPADTRERFGNSVANMYAFLSDPKNHEEGVSLGFLAPKSKKAVGGQGTTEEVVPAPAGASGAASATSTPPPEWRGRTLMSLVYKVRTDTILGVSLWVIGL